MGSGSSSRLTETVKANSISQEFHNNNKNKQKYQRFSYCSIASDTNHQLNNQPSLYDNHTKQINTNANNKYFKFPDASSSSNVNTILLPNRFKSFENFIAPNQMQQQQLQQLHQQQYQKSVITASKQTTPDTFETISNSNSNKLTKSLIMYDVDFEKFNRCNTNDSTTKLDKSKSNNNSMHNRSFKTMNVTSSVYHDLIELDKDLAKRENDLKFYQQRQQQQQKTSSLLSSSNRISSSSSSESSSGCSSGASSSNLSVSRRKSINTIRKNTNDSSLYSVNTTSQFSTFKTGNTNSNKDKKLPSESQSNLSNKTSPLLTSASSSSTTSSCSNKSILSTSANLSSSCSSISSPTQYFSPKSVSYNKSHQKNEHHNHQHHHSQKRAQNRRSLFNKTKSECLFNNSLSQTKDDKDNLYVRNFPTVAEHLNQEKILENSSSISNKNNNNSEKSKLKKSSKTNRDSGIIVDLFHLNGSMTNLKTKFNNAKINLRNSFSVFNLKHSSTSSSLASNKKSKKKSDSNSSSTNSNNIHEIPPVCSSISINKIKEINNNNNHYDLEELNHNTSVSSSSSSSSTSSAISTPNDENNNNNVEILKQHNSKENFFNNNNNKTTTSTKSKLNTISSSINNFLSNLTINNTNNNGGSSSIIKNSNVNENCFTSSTNLVLNKNNINDTLISNDSNNNNNNDINNQTRNFIAESNCANTLSLSSTNLTSASTNHTNNNNNNESNYKLTRFSNSVKINDNKQQQLQNKQQQQQFIKRTMTFHSTNNPTKRETTESSSSSSSTNDASSSFKSTKSNGSVLKVNILNPTSLSNSNQIKLINSNTLSSFKTTSNQKTDNIIPIMSFEKRLKQQQQQLPQSQQLQHTQMKHSASLGATVDELQQQQTKSSGLASHRHQKIVVQASTSDLLNCFSVYISEKCSHLLKESYINPLTYMNNDIGKRIKFESRDTINWLRSADRALLIQGWQEIAFMNPVNVVFVYLLVRDTLNDIQVKSVYELQCYIMACLYLAFSYMGNEISYPLKPFLIEDNRDIFWQRVVDLMNKLSSCMLKINRDPRFFTELFYELKSYSVIIKKPEPVKLPQTISQSTSLMNNSCYKQLTDQINSIEIKIDSFSKSSNNLNSSNKQLHNNDDENNKLSKTSQISSNININKSLVQLNESSVSRTRTGLNNENQNPFNSYCI